VPVATTTSIVPLSSSATPITLPVSATRIVSGTATLNPASLTEVTYVTAKQTVGATPVVTVKFVAADDLALGAYSLTLPTGAPLRGQYGTGTLPIAFVAQAGAAGKYAAEASAIGYQTQSVNADISAANATRDFILIP